MKKVLLSGAALALAFGMASTASAVDFKMKGDYTVEGIYQSSADGGGVILNEGKATSVNGGVSNTADAWYQHTFRILPTMKVNDKVTMAAEIRLADNNIWGNQGATVTTNAGDTTVGATNGTDVYVHRLYMDWMSPMGKVRVGRTPAGPYGPDFMNTDVRQNRIMFWPNWLSKPWDLLFYTAKVTERDGYADTTLAGTGINSTDSDRYEGRIGYTTANTKANVRYWIQNNNNAIDNEPQFLGGYYNRKFDNGVYMSAEAQFNFGSASATTDFDAMGGIIEVGKQYGNWSPSIMYFYASGDDNTAGGDAEQFMATATGLGTSFTPLVVMTGRTTGLLNGDQRSSNAAMRAAGVHALVLATDYKMSDRMTLHGALGWAQADEEVNSNAGVANAGSYLNRDDDYGWEIDLGAAYKLLDNLTYEAHFGYLDSGDFFDSTATAADAESVYVVTNSLTMTF